MLFFLPLSSVPSSVLSVKQINVKGEICYRIGGAVNYAMKLTELECQTAKRL